MVDVQDASAVSGAGIVAKALEVMGEAAGSPYKWGGTTTAGFDCSGFVQYVLKSCYPSKTFPRTVDAFERSPMFEEVTDPKPGDLIVFPGTKGGAVDHIGIVIDDSRWVGSQSSTGVSIVKTSNPYWSKKSKRFLRIRTISAKSVQAALQRTVSFA